VILYNAGIQLGANAIRPAYQPTAATAPSTSAGGYYGVKVPYYNNSGVTMNKGDIVLAVGGGTAYGTKAAVLATTTVMGVNAASLATATWGYMYISGYAVVNTTGTVIPGDIIVSTDTASGYGGKKSSPNAGEVVGTALSVGTAAGGLTLIKLK
jgi:hypothetical protein